MRIKLDYRQREDDNNKDSQTKEVNEKDKEYKAKIKRNAQNRNTRPKGLSTGDKVLLKQNKANKWTPPYETHAYIVYKIKGSSVWAKRMSDGREVCRDKSEFKFLGKNRPPSRLRDKGRPRDWREDAVRKARSGITNMHHRDNNQNLTVDNHDRENEQEPRTVPRRSERVRNPPDRYGDFHYY